MAHAARRDGAADSAAAADSGVVPMRIILQLGSTNDAAGTPDACAHERARRVAELYSAAVASGRTVRVLTSGGVEPLDAAPRFNPTRTPHWQLIRDLIQAAGVPPHAILPSGLEALHTVDEALMARAFVEELPSQAAAASSGAAGPSCCDELVVVTSDYHAPRARHLFGVAFGAQAGLARCIATVEEVPSALPAEAHARRVTHEKAALATLRREPFGGWLAFLRERGLEGANRSLRWSRRLSSGDASDAGGDAGGAAAAAGGGGVAAREAG